MTRTIGAAIGFVLFVLFLATMAVEHSRQTPAPAPAALTAHR